MTFHLFYHSGRIAESRHAYRIRSTSNTSFDLGQFGRCGQLLESFFPAGALDDILIIAPYNAQVFELQDRLKGARIGTVDKFQGQEAPLPSWTEDGRCTNIFAIHIYGFYYEKKNCEAVKMQLGKSTAPSGTSYTATITARCRPDGAVTAGELQTFKFDRYKGNLFVTTK